MKTVQITITRSRQITKCSPDCEFDRSHIHHLVMRGDDWHFLSPILGDSDSLVVAWGIAHSEWLWDVAPAIYAWLVEHDAPIPRTRRAGLLVLHAALVAAGSRWAEISSAWSEPYHESQRTHLCGPEFVDAAYRLRLMLFVTYGRQPDGSFVVDTGRHFDSLDGRGRKLFAPAKQGLLAHFSCSQYNARTKVLTELHSRADARAKTEAERSERKEATREWRWRQFTEIDGPLTPRRLGRKASRGASLSGA